MKLKHFNATTAPKIVGGGSKVARIAFNKAGTISINHQGCDLLGIKTGDKLTLAQDEEDPLNWYLFKDEAGFELRIGYDKKGCLFNHSALVKSFLQSQDLAEDVSHSCIIAGQPTTIKGDKTKYFGLLIPKTV